MENFANILLAMSYHHCRMNNGSGQPTGCTPAEVEHLLKQSAAAFGRQPCGQYIELLRQLDGIMYDGNVIYAHRTHPLFGPGAITSRAVGSPDIDGFVELNRFWRQRCRVDPDVLVYGGNEVYLYIGYGESRFCYLPGYPLPGEPLVSHVDKAFPTFNDMLLDVFEQLLERARDRGEL